MKTKRTALAFILLAALTVTAYAPRAHAQQYDSESDFEVRREGNGITIIGYVGLKQAVRIPPTIQGLPVTGIGIFAFRGCQSLTSVTIPNGVTSIGDGAFAGCVSLASVTIPNSFTSIGTRAFMYCASLSNVTIPDGVTSIGQGAFMYCASLSSVTIPDGVTSIGAGAFMYCVSLTRVTIPNSVNSIKDYAFRDCTSLTSVTFQGTIPASNFSANALFPGDLRDKCLAGGAGRYTRASGGETWTRQ